MSLAHATRPDGAAISIEGGAPFPTDALLPLVDVPFSLPCDDPWVGGDGDDAHAYVDAARVAWDEYPEWMDFLALDSPANAVKRASRDIYLHWWGQRFTKARRALDVGCGIGRFVHPLLDRGASVWGVDPDLESLQRCAWRAPGRPGKLDLTWASAHRLPDVGDLDAIIACEVLCYIPDFTAVLAELAGRLRSGGALLLGWEGAWGWPLSPDASPASAEQLLGRTRVIDIAEDRWLRTIEESELRVLLEGAGLRVERIVPTHYVPDGPFERAAPEDLYLEELLALEADLRAHPIYGPLNRIWTAVAVKP